ncbi:MAG: DNA polymerase IV [Anaerolineae bacterium]|nr:DNA polymerase IV [Anaerolineae bacterium]
MTEQRAIIHLDLDAFFAAVEVIEDPSLAGRPVVVGGRPEDRGVVSSASYEARAFGVHSAMPTYRALALCPNAVLRPPRHGVYRTYSQRVMALLEQASPLVEQTSVDEAYLDLTDQVSAWDEAVGMAHALQRRVRDEVGLSASLGVASNKLVAKVASDYDKPGGLTVVPPGDEATFLAPLPVRVLWGIGPVTVSRLAEIGVETVGDLARADPVELARRLGTHGLEMVHRARGIDDRPVVPEHETKSVSQERTFRHDLVRMDDIHHHLLALCEGVAERLQNLDLAAGTIAIKVRYADFTDVGRQMSLDVPTADAEVLYRAALALLHRAWKEGRPVRLLGLAARRLSPPHGQLRLL